MLRLSNLLQDYLLDARSPSPQHSSAAWARRRYWTARHWPSASARHRCDCCRCTPTLPAPSDSATRCSAMARPSRRQAARPGILVRYCLRYLLLLCPPHSGQSAAHHPTPVRTSGESGSTLSWPSCHSTGGNQTQSSSGLFQDSSANISSRFSRTSLISPASHALSHSGNVRSSLLRFPSSHHHIWP